VELEVDKELTALSTGAAISETPTSDGKKKLVKFATTPVMSSYLVAFIVGEFEYIETIYDNVPVRLYTVPGKKEQGTFALEMARKAMLWYNDWFAFKSPLPKVDLIAIPDFSMGKGNTKSIKYSRFFRCDGKLGSCDVSRGLPVVE
jgi:aminopeptidase N